MVDVRGKPGLNLPPSCYGNSSVSLAAVSNTEILCKNPLKYAAELVKKAEALVTEKYIRSVADFLVVKGRPPYSRSWNFIVSDTTCADFGEVDFGWGKPVYGGPVSGTSFSSPYALFRNGDGEDGIVVAYMFACGCYGKVQGGALENDSGD
ncbi:Methanol O-anthraniloyltransferase [Camellia lanceoleosa]|uniref:Methanol O-anthraniloyltransferase n=1 Tax=Camellia lanceoleosa TaxID=1840588 RepID=A0ACC0FMM6_9ERIC|nr:Methanol O-anthraniloyltransferase [Camellia lanceoleosa]